MNEVKQLPVTEQTLRDALHELIGFIAASTLTDNEKKLAMNLPSVALVSVPTYIVPSGVTIMEIRK